MLIFRRPQIQQPPGPAAANAKWRARGMAALFDCRHGFEVISGQQATTDATARAQTGFGVAPDFSSTAQVYAHRPDFAITGDLTIFVFCDVDALTNYGALISKQATTTTHCPYELRLGGGSPTTSQIAITKASGSSFSNRAAYAGNVVSAGQRGVRIIHASNNRVDASGTCWVNGLEQAYTGSGSTAPTDNGASVYIGRRYDGATQLDGRISHIALFPFQFTTDLAMELDALPFDLFEPARVMIPVGIALAPSDTGIAYVAAQARGSARPLITQAGVAQAPGQAAAAAALLNIQAAAAQAAAQALAPSASTNQQTAIAQAAAQALGADASTTAGAYLGLATAPPQARGSARPLITQPGLSQAGAQALADGSSTAQQAGMAQAPGQALAQVITATTITATGLAAGAGQAFASTADAAAGAPPDYGTPAPRKRRFVVRNGDELLLFDNPGDASAAQRAIDEWQAHQPAKTARGATNGRRAVPKPQPAPAEALPAAIEAISVPDLRGLAVGYGMQAVYDQAIALRDLDRAAALWQQLRAEEDEAERMLLEDDRFEILSEALPKLMALLRGRVKAKA